MALLDMQCRTAKPREKNYKLFDAQGLYLEVTTTGTRTWWLKYRYQQKEKRISIGIYPKVTLQQARIAKDKIKTELQTGYDPVLLKKERKFTARFESTQTFELVAREWFNKHVDVWNPRYAKTLMHRLEKYTFHDLGPFPIHMLRPPMILASLEKIEKTGPDMARRIKQLISLICRYGIATNRLTIDPTIGLETAMRKYRKGHFASIEVNELGDLLKAFQNHKARMHRQTNLAFKLMLLTFVRTGELVTARWIDIDFEKAIWIIPETETKMRRAHIVPLSRQCLKILTELQEMNGHFEYVFPSLPRPIKPMSKGSILVALKRMGFNGRMTGHGFRSLALGILKEKLNYSHEIADRQLAHVPKSSTDRAYDRAKFLPQRTSMMQEYADYIDSTYQKIVPVNFA
jgi:integrase